MWAQGMRTPTVLYASEKRNGQLVVTASAVVPTDPALVLRAHSDPAYAPAFRDILKYALFERDGPVLRTAYAARLGPLHVPLAVNKRVSEREGVVDFWTSPASMASFRGRWTVVPMSDGGALLQLRQTMDLPAWARFLPVEAAVRGRVMRAIEDTCKLETRAKNPDPMA